MPFAPRKCRSRTHSSHTEFHTTPSDRETHDYTRARCGVRPRAPPGTSWGRAVPRVKRLALRTAGGPETLVISSYRVLLDSIKVPILGAALGVAFAVMGDIACWLAV